MEQKGCIDQACIAINVDKNLTGERSDKMAYKNHEGYLDPTSGQAMQNTHWEELQQLREKEHGLKRGQKIVLTEMYREEHKPARKIQRTYIVLELYKYCVLLKDDKGYRTAPSYIQLQMMMRGVV